MTDHQPDRAHLRFAHMQRLMGQTNRYRYLDRYRDRNGMAPGHERLDVYRLAIAYVAWGYEKAATACDGNHSIPIPIPIAIAISMRPSPNKAVRRRDTAASPLTMDTFAGHVPGKAI